MTTLTGTPAPHALPAPRAHPAPHAHPAAYADSGSRPAHPGHAARRVRASRPSRPSRPRRHAVALVLAVVAVAVAAALALQALAPGGDRSAGTSQNGWPEITSGDDPRLVRLPWVTGRVLGGDVATVLGYVAERFDAEVEPVDPDASWGWAHRPVRGGTTLSNHASATAIDLNAPLHPLGVRGTFTDEQVAAIRAILADVAPAVAWGGDYADRPDEMHLEIVGDPDVVAEVAARLRG
ncbi:M15 family metallopeptidase [Cellulomonas sp. C5510]|uniref:M15 family metallopeptidase n=1 Tax=Cellulomonas sp. C5510 TaxID=2871170 RepID=UPI001C938766|nr:M15 family metallopeptidase [Cellulomonas sp. C5510]QZN85529.1 M15 family metallopeptidase [Cellulomonas sp. C5510]